MTTTMTTIKSIKISTFCDTKVDIENVNKHFIVYSPIEGDINEPWKYAIGNLPDGFKISDIKCTGDCEKVHFYDQNGLTFFYLTFYCASYHEIIFELEQDESPKIKSPADHPGVFKFEKSKDGTIFVTFELESAILESLSYHELYSTDINLPDYESAKFKLLINKISDTHFSINIENANDVKIDGLPGNFTDVFSLINENLTFVRTFSFTKNEKKKENPQITVNSTKSNPTVTSALKNFVKNTVEKSFQELLEEHQQQQHLASLSLATKETKSLSDQTLATVEALKAVSDAEDTASITTTFSSRGTSLISESTSSKTTKFDGIKEEEKQKQLLQLQNILFKNQYTDVILKASNGIQLQTYRCILAAYSPTFKSIFDFSEDLPIEIECIKFNAETILRVLSFLYGKDELLDGDEMNLLEFANEYAIEALKAKCCTLLEAKVNIKNVCEYVKIADDNGFKGLKQKCIKIIAENKNEIDKKDISTIPHSILLETFYS